MKVMMDYKEHKNVDELEVETNDIHDRITVKIGNTVVDIKVGSQTKRAVVDIYPYENEKPYGFIINDDKRMGVCWRDGETTS